MAGVHIVVRCMGHKSLKIGPGDTLKIGRHHTNDLVLNDGTVSRFHCSIEWDKDEDRPWLVDNKSANGVEVDGEDVDGKHYLVGDNQIGVGDFTVILQLKGAKAVTKRTQRFAPKPVGALLDDDDDETSVRLFSASKRRLRGTFTSKEELQKVLVDLETDQRTGTLVVKEGARHTKAMFGQGRLITVKEKGGGSGRGALMRLVEVAGGSYVFTADVEPTEENMDMSITEFLQSEGESTMRFQKSPLDD